MKTSASLRMLPLFILLLVAPAMAQRALPATAASPTDLTIDVDPKTEMARLLTAEDADHDKKITINDRPRTFWLHDRHQNVYEVSGVDHLANLLSELKLLEERGEFGLRADRVYENPVVRISRLIRQMYWDALTRRVDASSLAEMLEDSKIPRSQTRYLYVPHADAAAAAYFERVAKELPALHVEVRQLPAKIDAATLVDLQEHHGLLSLALRTDASGKTTGVPFVGPGGRFNEMYGWDSYFESLGLLADGRLDLAKDMVDNLVYEIENYGKILNANRSYYLNRSQPPFLTSMISEVYAHLDHGSDSREWLRHSLTAAMKEYFNVWTAPPRLTKTGLSRYFGTGTVIPPEVEKGHFDFILKPAAKRHGISVAEVVRRFNSGTLKDPILSEFFAQDRAVRESGHDTTYRWRVDGVDRAADFVTVDLNSLIYKYEIDFARLIKSEFKDRFNFGDQTFSSEDWYRRARDRKALIRKYLWDEQRHMFFDFDTHTDRRSEYVSATAFYPLWAQDPAVKETSILSVKDAHSTIDSLLAKLESPGGIAATARSSWQDVQDPKNPRQWDFPNGWAPHQMIAWSAMSLYGRGGTAERLIYKWLYTITRNAADFNGTIPEKFDVEARSHAVFAEYGNVGTRFSYITREGFGWMNASYEVGLKRLSPARERLLEQLRPPEWIRFDTD